MTTRKVFEFQKGMIRGPRLTREELEELKLSSIINLENKGKAVNNEKVYCKNKNIIFIHIPMSEFFPPSIKKLKRGAYQIHTTKKTVLVHCRHGVDRTGFMIAAYRILYENYTLNEAYQECLNYGHNVFLYWWWKRSLSKLKKK